jgi:predicted nucleotide-binding protein
VFVVHGRNERARKAMFRFLRSISLAPLEWEQVVNATGKGAPTVIEILDRGFEMAQAVVVLFTADDLARLRKRYRRPDDPAQEKNLAYQPRPNVLFEAGMAFGRHPQRTIIVQITKEDLRGVSDLQGVHVIRMDDSPGRRTALLDRLRHAGCSVQAGSDWLTEGNFKAAM